MMYILKAEGRNLNLKPKKLRACGFIPACVYGSNLTDSLLLQIPQKEVNRLLKVKSTGSTVTLDAAGKKITALLKEISRNPLSNQIEQLSFQSLVADEPVTSMAKLILLNKEKGSNFVQQLLFELPYRALPSDLVEKIEIDLDGMTAGDSIRIEDLPIAHNEDIELLIAPDSMIVNIVEPSNLPADSLDPVEA